MQTTRKHPRSIAEAWQVPPPRGPIEGPYRRRSALGWVGEALYWAAGVALIFGMLFSPALIDAFL